MKQYIIFLFLTCWFFAANKAEAQKQLVLLRGEKVIMRFNPGDEFVIRLKGEKNKIKSYINNLFDTAVMVHQTTIPYRKIDRVYLNQSGLVNLIGKFLVVAGVGYFLIDQINVVVVNGDKATLNDNVTTTSVAMVAVGLPMMLIKKKYERISGRTRLMLVEEGSPFYLETIRQE
ncbi:hypothetical protein [Chryseolinea sp. H1M3-3]|uniref:hypothetical protein n=1 Tax=Chryseolinea sp. H1M3-3 TaxID=3034144 RepID=UPI0023EC6575|nr:hypothetical protein [Chryseolinea sp. H1M3-3]